MAGPQLDRVDPLKLADRVLEAFWQLLKKKARTSRFNYRVIAWNDAQAYHPNPPDDVNVVQGYLVFAKAIRPQRCVAIVGDERRPLSVLLVAGDATDFTDTGQPRRSPGRDRVSVLPQASTRRGLATRDRKAAELMLTALKFGRFDPDIVQRIGALAPSS